MNKYWKRPVAALLAAVLCFSPLTVSAEEQQGTAEISLEPGAEDQQPVVDAQPGTEEDTIQATPELEPDTTETPSTEKDDNVVIEKDDKPYLALGADLSAEQQAVVLGLMGISQEELANYNVTYVTNTEEHTYLDEYISAKEIGSKSWSSIVIVKRDKGNGINISTKNINYCTIGMYKNALVTAGIADADIIVAGPKPISGTAALVGIFKAYSDMTGEAIAENSMDTALNELVLTGQLANGTGADSEDVEAMIAYLKQKVAEGALQDENSIRDAINDACGEFNVSLSDEEKSQLIDLLLKIKDLDLDVDSLLSQAQSIYDKLSDMGFDTSAGSGIGAAIKSFFTGIVDAIKNFFSNIFS